MSMHFSARQCKTTLCTHYRGMLRKQRVLVLHWPACSPDPSPVKNVWEPWNQKMWKQPWFLHLCLYDWTRQEFLREISGRRLQKSVIQSKREDFYLNVLLFLATLCVCIKVKVSPSEEAFLWELSAVQLYFTLKMKSLLQSLQRNTPSWRPLVFALFSLTWRRQQSEADAMCEGFITVWCSVPAESWHTQALRIGVFYRAVWINAPASRCVRVFQDVSVLSLKGSCSPCCPSLHKKGFEMRIHQWDGCFIEPRGDVCHMLETPLTLLHPPITLYLHPSIHHPPFCPSSTHSSLHPTSLKSSFHRSTSLSVNKTVDPSPPSSPHCCLRPPSIPHSPSPSH